MTHFTPAHFLDRRVNVALIGCGGNGSQMLTGLARLNHALTALGHPGLHVTAFDGDTVSDANIGRKMFSPADVGQYKSAVLVHRLNAFFGLDWHARPKHAGADELVHVGPGIAIVCVDSAAARAKLAKTLQSTAAYVMDLGNRASDGQVIFGQAGRPNAKAAHRCAGRTTCCRNWSIRRYRKTTRRVAASPKRSNDRSFSSIRRS
ncbi:MULTISPECIES: PRTRC system ThiF family protein [Paraburkholderia]|uniref:PRTRC system ThiF family protein n=1 Tax=Paraburkholderia TaxID=1822464 RepID=UPI00321848E1